MLLGTLDASLSGNLLTGKDIIRAGKSTSKAGEGTIRAASSFNNFWNTKILSKSTYI